MVFHLERLIPIILELVDTYRTESKLSNGFEIKASYKRKKGWLPLDDIEKQIHFELKSIILKLQQL